MEGLDSLKQALAGIIQKIDKLSGPGRPKLPEGVEGAKEEDENEVEEKSGLDLELGESAAHEAGESKEFEAGEDEEAAEAGASEESESEEEDEDKDELDMIFAKAKKK